MAPGSPGAVKLRVSPLRCFQRAWVVLLSFLCYCPRIDNLDVLEVGLPVVAGVDAGDSHEPLPSRAAAMLAGVRPAGRAPQ